MNPPQKVQFSFHHESAAPGQTASGKWNCSLDHWPLFHTHFPCNVLEECEGGEDEAGCPYRTQMGAGCQAPGPGFPVSVGGRCYALFAEGERHVTWNEAANECLRRGTYLASLNSPREWDDVTEFVARYVGRDVYLGLHAGGANLPEL